MALIRERTYTTEVSGALVEEYREWTPIADIPAKWVKVIPHDDGTLEVWFSSSYARPKESA